MNKIFEISFLQLSVAYFFILLLLVITRLLGIKREKLILLSCIRMSVQLLLVGYVLGYVFANSHWWLSILVVFCMVSFAIFNVFSRAKHKPNKKMKLLIAFAMYCGTFFTLFFFILLVIRIKPWWTPQYFIPIAGMIVGNSMTGITIGLNSLLNEFNNKKAEIENSLMLGATPKQASWQIVKNSFDAAILPTINSMIGMGLISLPGMMTGQILSGTLPTVAIKYQIGIMLAIVGSLSVTLTIFITLGYKVFFNKDSQLI